jgi:hypothetical protein
MTWHSRPPQEETKHSKGWQLFIRLELAILGEIRAWVSASKGWWDQSLKSPGILLLNKV